MKESLVSKAACILVLVSLPAVSVNELGYYIDSVELVVYRDGLVHVTQSLTVNETFPVITVKLLAPLIENVIVVDENDALLDYEIKDFNMTVFSLGARKIVMEYDTVTLTQKEAGVWTLTLDTPYNLTVKLPEEATIIYLNEVPTAISIEDNRTILRLFPGQWEISYVPPIVPPEPPPPMPPPTPTPTPASTPSSRRAPIPPEYLIGVVILVVVVALFFLLRRRGLPRAEKMLKEHPELRAEDREVIRFIAQRGGKALEAELREEFPELPRTTVWRLVKRLEKMEMVTIKKIGFQNQIELRE